MIATDAQHEFIIFPLFREVSLIFSEYPTYSQILEYHIEPYS